MRLLRGCLRNLRKTIHQPSEDNITELRFVAVVFILSSEIFCVCVFPFAIRFSGEGADEECPYEDSEVDVPSDKEVYDPK